MRSLERLGGGRNSKVYKLITGNSDHCTAKFFSQTVRTPATAWALNSPALHSCGPTGDRCVPRPVIADRENGCMVCEYVEGQKIITQEVTDSDLDYAVRFLSTLKVL